MNKLLANVADYCTAEEVNIHVLPALVRKNIFIRIKVIECELIENSLILKGKEGYGIYRLIR